MGSLRGFICLLVLVAGSLAPAETPSVANTDSTYQSLRNITLSTESISVENAVLKRDAGTFTFQSGTICFLQPVNGKVTGAVFVGNGTFTLEPPTDGERRALSYLTKQPDKMTEEFNELTLRFTDGTYEELKKQGFKAGQGTCSPDPLNDSMKALRNRLQLRYNLIGRILQDVLSTEPGGLFAAFIKGRKYSGKMLFIIDPHGVPELNTGFSLAPEEVALLTYDENKEGIWAAFHLAHEYANSTVTNSERNGWLHIDSQKIEALIEKSGRLSAKASTTFAALANGLRVVPLDLYPTLRVSSVTDAAGKPLSFIQEDKDEDYQFFVILPQSLKKGETFTITTSYAGKDAVSNEGGGNYYVSGGARTSWYPNTTFEDYATFDMRFTYPKDFKLVATGVPVSEKTEGNQAISEWKTPQPITVAGFQFGRFKYEKRELKEFNNFTIEAYANTEPPDDIKALERYTEEDGRSSILAGNWSTTGMIKKAMGEAEISAKIYSDYFGPSPFNRIAISQQTAMTYGQSWPGLVWLPMSYFYDSTIRHQIGFDDLKGYFKTVGPHEIAHQWFGHTVTWGSYRDQWMSEGFSELAASLFLQFIQRNPQEFVKFWEDQRELITERNRQGFRAIDVGPVTMGYRLNNTRTGNIARSLIYPKGGYILHMIRMMMWQPRSGDELFKQAMREFVKTYHNKPATTEDFKAIVEKHMTPMMDLDGNKKLDWFFNQYVYGTALPTYKFEHTFENGANGGTILNIKLTQSNVDDQFRMVVPVYLEFDKGKVMRLGSIGIQGNRVQQERVDLSGLKERPKRALFNYYNDVLCSVEQ